MRKKKIVGRLAFFRSLSLEEKRQVDVWDKTPEVSKYREIGGEGKRKLKSINFGIYDKATSKLIGSIGVSSIDLENKHAEIGLAIGDKDYWGKGYGADATKVILKYCFDELRLNKVYLDVWQKNKRAIRCYLKCGFKEDGVLRQHVRKDNKYYDKLIMSILKMEW